MLDLGSHVPDHYLLDQTQIAIHRLNTTNRAAQIVDVGIRFLGSPLILPCFVVLCVTQFKLFRHTLYRVLLNRNTQEWSPLDRHLDFQYRAQALSGFFRAIAIARGLIFMLTHIENAFSI